MRSRRAHDTRILACGLAALLLAGAAGAREEIEIPSRADAVVIYFAEAPGGVEGEAEPPWLRVYGDGHVRVHFPVGMKRAGDYAMQLDRPQMRALVKSLLGRRVVDFDPEDARGRKRAADLARRGQPQELTSASDPSDVTLELRLDRWRRADGRELRNVDKRIQWRGLRADRRRYPNVRSVRDLAAAADELRALMHHPDLEPVTGEAP